MGGSTPPLPLEALSLAPQVPPRRKKSAPAAFHLQVLQSSPQLLGALSCSDNSPTPLPEGGTPLPNTGPSSSLALNSTINSPQEMMPGAASMPGHHQDPFWSLLRHPPLANSSPWLSKSSDSLDLGGLARNPTNEELPQERRPSGVGPQDTVGDKDQRMVLQAFDPLAQT